MVRPLSAATFILAVFGYTVCGEVYKGGRSRNHLCDYTQFMKLSDRIWTYLSSWNDSFICKRDFIKNITNDTVQMETQYNISNRKYSYNLTGKLSNVWGKKSPKNLLHMKD
ncbi:hypothetical protein MRX96_049490, partial [Rhipicephalus microplus]